MKVHLSKSDLLARLRSMLRIRRFEEKCAELYTQEKIRGFLHLYIGEEAIAVGVIEALNPEDAIFATYREHGHALARGLDIRELMAEMYGKRSGSSLGRGGSMHIFDRSKGFYGGSAIVAGALPLAVGMGLADQQLGRNRVSACFFGEGAVAEGEFHESINLAVLWKLPVLFVCENNGYAMGTALERSESETSVAKKAASYGIASRSVDGMNVIEVEVAAREACEAIRAGEGPQLLECLTYRLRGHSMFDTQLYRSQEEVTQWLDKGPIVQFKRWLQESGYLDDDALEQIERQVEEELQQAVDFAEQAPLEAVEDLALHVYAEGE